MRRFGWAMGTVVELAVLGGDEEGDIEARSALLDDAERQLAELERHWSRFRPDSDVARANRADGEAVAVRRSTAELVALAVRAWDHTGGRFDPTVLDAVVAAGYDRPFELIEDELIEDAARAEAPADRRPPGHPAPGCRGIQVDDVGGVIRLPAGVHLDLGGIGKGRAADLLVTRLAHTSAGTTSATGVLVNLGGDLRCAGRPGDGDRWRIDLTDPFEPSARLTTLEFTEGAVATSTTARRAWMTGDGPGHHLIDPRSGRPTASGLTSVTVVAADAVWAEVVAKAVVVAGLDAGLDLVESLGLAALAVTDGGDLVASMRLPTYLGEVDVRLVPTPADLLEAGT
jgi:thiamine biosynthesis lipoprotein